MKKVFLIESVIDCRIFLRDHWPVENNFVIVSDNADVETVLARKHISFKTKADFLAGSELKKIKKISIQYMDSWYRYKDFLKYKGLQVGSLFSLDYGFFEKIVLHIEKIMKIAEKEEPGAIIVSRNLRSLTESSLCACGRQDIQCEEYRVNIYDAAKSKLLNNPYYRYLTKSFKLRILLSEIRDYVLPVPREFMMKGKGFLKVDNNSILVTAANRNEVRSSANTIRELKKRGYNVALFVMDGDGGAVLRHLEMEGFVEYIRPGDLFSQYYRVFYKKVCNSFEEMWNHVSVDPAFTEHLNYKGIPILRFVDRIKLKWMITKLSPYWAVIYEMISDLIKNSSAKAVIAMNDPVNLGRAAAVAANGAAIPSIDIQHGAYVSIPARAAANKWCIWSNFEKNLLASDGIPDWKLEVTGNSFYDSLYAKKFESDHIRSKIEIPDSYERIITWAPSAEWLFCYSEENYNERMFQGLQKAAGRYKDIKFLFKPHPAERVKRFRKILDKSLDNVSIIDSDLSIDEILYISDIVMSWNSSVLVEAVVFDKPIIGMNFFGQIEKVRCVSEGVAIEARSVGELEKAIEDIISNNGDIAGSMKRARAAYIEKFLYKLDGMASSRIADALEGMMKMSPCQTCAS